MSSVKIISINYTKDPMQQTSFTVYNLRLNHDLV